MTTPDVDRLRRVLGTDDLRWLVDRVRARLSRGEPVSGPVNLAGATPAQRQAIERLLGRRPGRGSSLVVSLDDVDAVMRRSDLSPNGLAAAVTLLYGEVVEIATAAAERQAAWDGVFVPVAAVARARPELREWTADVRTRGLVRRLLGDVETAAPVLAALARVLAALPADGVPLARFAAATAGSPHALDHGNPLTTLAESAIKAAWAPLEMTAAGPAERRRELWATVRVLLDELSSTVLCLNLDAAPSSYLHRFLGPARDAGEPIVLTLRQVARTRSRFVDRPVFVCENPTVLASAADMLGDRCPSMVCISGQPSVAALQLLSALHADGASLHYHGDFDWGGVRIANLLRSRVPWLPWRYDIDAYRAAAAAARRPLEGRPVAALWDIGLAEVMSDIGLSIDEEVVLDDLLDDLRDAPPSLPC